MNTIKVKLHDEIINHNLIKRITTHPFGAPNPFPFLSIKESGMPERKRKMSLPQNKTVVEGNRNFL